MKKYTKPTVYSPMLAAHWMLERICILHEYNWLDKESLKDIHQGIEIINKYIWNHIILERK